MSITSNNTNTHLVVNRLSAMGDVAMTVPVILAFQEQYPEAKITVITKAFLSPFFENIPHLQVLVWDTKKKHRGFWGIVKMYFEIKALQPTHFADLHNVLRSKILFGLLKLSKIQCQKINKGRKEKKALTRWNNKVFKPIKSTHERYLEVFKKLGFKNCKPNKSNTLPKQEFSDELTCKIKFQSSKKNIGIAPFAAHASKTYPLDKMKQVIEAINENENYQVYLFGGGKAEQKQLEDVAESLKNTQSLVGKLTFKEELQVISNLDAMIAMDSGNGHLAAMYGVPVMTIWGLTHPYAGFAPFMQEKANQILPDRNQFPKIPTSVYGNKYPEGYLEAFETIDYRDIIQRCLEILK